MLVDDVPKGLEIAGGGVGHLVLVYARGEKRQKAACHGKVAQGMRQMAVNGGLGHGWRSVMLKCLTNPRTREWV